MAAKSGFLHFLFDFNSFEAGTVRLYAEGTPSMREAYFYCKASSLFDAWRKLLAEVKSGPEPDERERDELTLSGIEVHPELWDETPKGLEDRMTAALEAEAKEMGILG